MKVKVGGNMTESPSGEYDNFYGTEKCVKENEFIIKLLSMLEGSIIDLGCGTGLGFSLLPYRLRGGYVGCDVDKEMLAKAQKNYPLSGAFIERDAFEMMRDDIHCCDNVISLWSLNYINPEVIDLLYEKMIGVFIAVHYNEPYLEGGNNYMVGHKEEFIEKFKSHNKSLEKFFVDKNDHVLTVSFLGEPYYWLTIMRGERTNPILFNRFVDKLLRGK